MKVNNQRKVNRPSKFNRLLKFNYIPKSLIYFSALWSFTFFLFCVALPLWALIQEGVRGGVWNQMGDPAVLAVVRSTLQQVFWSTLISGGMGLVLGLGLGKTHLGNSHFGVFTLFSLPMGIPTIVAALAWVSWIGRSGFLAQLGFNLDWSYSLKAVVLAHSFYNIPLVTLMVANSRRQISNSHLEVLESLGARPFHVFLYGIWPNIRWAWASACVQVMGLCSMSFALVMILGGGPPVQTLETEVYERMRYGSGDLSGALACAFWEIIITLLPWGLVLFCQAQEQSVRKRNGVAILPDQSKKKKNYALKIFSWKKFYLGLGLIFLLPYFAVIRFRSLAVIRESLHSEFILRALKLSISLSLWSATFAILTAVTGLIFLFFGISRRRQAILTALYGLPSGISVLVLGLGFWLAYARWIDPFEGSPWAMVLLQTVLFSPIAFRILWPIAESASRQQFEVALSLGASWWNAFWQVEWFRWRGPLFTALGGVFGACIGEVAAVSLFANNKWVPLPLVISQWMRQYRFDDAQDLAGILLIIILCVMIGTFEVGNQISKK